MNISVHHLFGLGLLMWLSGCDKIAFETVSGTYPVKDIKLTVRDRRVVEIFVQVHPGVRVDSVVEMSFFDGLDHATTLETAKQRLGEPRSIRVHPDMRLPVSLYAVAKGEIGFMSVPTSGGAPRQPQVWAFPTNQAPATVILEASLRAQVVQHLTADRPIRVHILRDVGHGGVTLSMTSNRVDYLILGPRDGE
jgi:hypothetical protein